MKKTVPLVIGMIFGAFALAEFYIPHHQVGALSNEFRSWAAILSAAAFIIGGVNILQVTWPKIRRREPDWGYKVVLLGAAAVMLVVGLPWHKLGDPPSRPTVTFGPSLPPSAPGERPPAAVVFVQVPADVTYQVGATVGVGTGDPEPVRVAAGEVTIKLSRRVAGYRPLETKVTVAAGDTVNVEGDPPMLWGRDGRVFVWIYDHVFGPANATLFALLAFFVASAAFRAFRARNAEAALLLGAAIFMMLGRAPLGRAISDVLPDLAQWLLDVPSNGGRRAIMMGAAIGAIATGLRVILGLERSHLGND
ncbi:MAG: hypothetical protein IPH44_02825 [Myxococcales bacterium]|nr:hypothetical protein [Myxococcales bacterium]MBK7198254.1 hypothetical protein [Myxococcales bacterium]MBP6845033.1 hypothetical protein [Kofleriaceae bacterium]